MSTPRVAYFPDSFHEVNGVAHTSRNFQAYAQRHALHFLCVRAGTRELPFQEDGNLATLELPRSGASIRMEKDLDFDPLFWRHESDIEDALDRFRPDVIHITGPSELGIFGAYFAWKRGIPLAASWHTNVHEYAARRSARITSLFAPETATQLETHIEDAALAATARFYRLAKVLFAPNTELCDLLAKATGLPCHLMQRGVETEIFSPTHRTRTDTQEFTLGYVGRLSVEKNVALLATIQQKLEARNITNFHFQIIGQGSEEQSLRDTLPRADFAGVLRGQALATAYANMDLLVFPSHTDTFGNVVLEALASGVPAIVTPDGGPKYIVEDGITGAIATDDNFTTAIADILTHPERHRQMRIAAREHALTCSWDAVFNRVYAAYDTIL